MQLGEEGTEQFAIQTKVNRETIKVQKIHDPFIRNKTAVVLSRWSCLLGLFQRASRTVCIEVIVRGSEGAQRAIMMLDPKQLSLDTNKIQHEREKDK